MIGFELELSTLWLLLSRLFSYCLSEVFMIPYLPILISCTMLPANPFPESDSSEELEAEPVLSSSPSLIGEPAGELS